MPASTLLPSVSPFTPLALSVIHPRLLNVFGASLPMSVSVVRLMYGACVLVPGRAVVGESGAGLSAL